jgi:hypothetical protein
VEEKEERVSLRGRVKGLHNSSGVGGDTRCAEETHEDREQGESQHTRASPNLFER